jgi:hypothetical protein
MSETSQSSTAATAVPPASDAVVSLTMKKGLEKIVVQTAAGEY